MFRHKCHFALAFCSVFFIVLSTLVVTSIISKGPVIFLKLSEDNFGEIDSFIFPIGTYQDIYPPYEVNFMNHTRVLEVVKNKSQEPYYYSPRKVFSGVFFYNGTLPQQNTKKLDKQQIRERFENRFKPAKRSSVVG
jgi:hypothetical protein